MGQVYLYPLKIRRETRRDIDIGDGGAESAQTVAESARGESGISTVECGISTPSFSRGDDSDDRSAVA
jgi:hypothetical protein